MDASDPFALRELFQEGGEPWLPLSKPTIETQLGSSRLGGFAVTVEADAAVPDPLRSTSSEEPR